MSLNTQWDSIQLQPLELPYNRVQAELNAEPRLYSGLNTFTTLGGKLAKRPGTIAISNSTINKRCDRLWLYETIDTPPQVYFIGSFYNGSSGKWELYYNRLSTSTGWVAVPTLRDSDVSVYPHELVVSRGLAYIKSFPDSGSSEKLGTLIFDGSGSSSPTTKPWGLLGPTEPTAIVGATTRISTPIASTSSTSLTVVTSSGFPATPFVAQIDFEQVTVSAVVGTTWTIARAANGTTASTHDTNAVVVWRDWSVSDHKVTVNWYWRYTYCYKTITGQVSNRAPIQTNIDKLPSATGPFFDLIPKFNYIGDVDTTNIPTVVIERTTDGGGTYWKLREIANPGAGTQTFSDTFLETGVSGGTFMDPIPDDAIDTSIQAPDLLSNSPPPTVLSPLVTGTDTPQKSTPIGSYSGRFFYAIGNVLFFSADEELHDGIPEESWPSGFKGNFFRFQYPVTNVQSTSDALYIFTLQATYQLTGTNLETFSIRPLFESIGHPYGHPRAVIRWNDVVGFLTQDYRIALITNSDSVIISDPLYTDLVDQANNNSAEFDFEYWGDLDKELLVVNGHVASDTTKTRQWCFDIKKSQKKNNLDPFKPFWNTPWTVRSTAMCSGRVNESTAQRRLIFFIWTGSTGSLVYLDTSNTYGTDYITGSGNTGYTFTAETGQFQVPSGDHVNSLRQPACTPVVYGYLYDRTLYNGDSDPQNYIYLDDFWSQPIPLNIKPPWRRQVSKGYKTVYCPVQLAAQHCALKIEKVSSTELFEMQNLTVIFVPDAGS